MFWLFLHPWLFVVTKLRSHPAGASPAVERYQKTQCVWDVWEAPLMKMFLIKIRTDNEIFFKKQKIKRRWGKKERERVKSPPAEWAEEGDRVFLKLFTTRASESWWKTWKILLHWWDLPCPGTACRGLSMLHKHICEFTRILLAPEVRNLRRQPVLYPAATLHYQVFML